MHFLGIKTNNFRIYVYFQWTDSSKVLRMLPTQVLVDMLRRDSIQVSWIRLLEVCELLPIYIKGIIVMPTQTCFLDNSVIVHMMLDATFLKHSVRISLVVPSGLWRSSTNARLAIVIVQDDLLNEILTAIEIQLLLISWTHPFFSCKVSVHKPTNYILVICLSSYGLFCFIVLIFVCLLYCLPTCRSSRDNP